MAKKSPSTVILAFLSGLEAKLSLKLSHSAQE
jgi:hypothetical protein